MLIAPRPDYLATGDEMRAGARIDQLEEALAEASPQDEALKLRIHRLKGLLTWSLETNYHERLTDTHRHLREVNVDVDAMKAQYEAFVRARQAATHSYVGYETPIKRLRMRVREARERLNLLMARQGHLLETVAIAELSQRQDRLEGYQNQARFAFADSYDRAAKAQAR
jgi:chromosome segregation ATPase